MFIKRILLSALFACIAATNLYAACPYISSFNSLQSEANEALANFRSAVTSENICDAEIVILVRKMLSINQKLIKVQEKARSQRGCVITGGGGSPEENVANINGMLEACSNVGPQELPAQQQPKCTTPPSPTTSPCFLAINTNSDSRCVYSFTYRVAGRKLQNGGNVNPGNSEERCALVPGEDIRFEKWTKSGANAK